MLLTVMLRFRAADAAPVPAFEKCRCHATADVSPRFANSARSLRRLGFHFAEHLERFLGLLLLAKLAVIPAKQIERLGIVWIERGRTLKPVARELVFSEFRERLAAQVEIAANTGFRSAAFEAPSRYPFFDQQAGQVRVRPVVLRGVNGTESFGCPGALHNRN